MATQLLLLDPADRPVAPVVSLAPAEVAGARPGRPADWRLDEHTREVGRRGIEEARRALAAAAQRVAAA